MIPSLPWLNASSMKRRGIDLLSSMAMVCAPLFCPARLVPALSCDSVPGPRLREGLLGRVWAQPGPEPARYRHRESMDVEPPEAPDAEAVRLVRDALRHLNDFVAIQKHPLTAMLTEPAAGPVAAGRQLRRVLLDAIAAVDRPTSGDVKT